MPIRGSSSPFSSDKIKVDRIDTRTEAPMKEYSEAVKARRYDVDVTDYTKVPGLTFVRAETGSSVP
jgi:hypothetical protein